MNLDALEQIVANDLKKISHPHNPWLLPHVGADGAPALDVLVVGGGQSGVAAAFGLKRSRIDNVLVIDQAQEGKEGPWSTYARMQTLRNPKDYTGPDLDIPSMTCQSWYEARFGADAWEALDIVPKAHWHAYLLWVRKVSGVAVANETVLTALVPEGTLLRAELLERGRPRTVYTRKVILATGQDSMGRWGMPASVAALPAERRAATADPIDFETLRGKTVAVIGAGASAFDNAAMALEAGAARVMLLCRRFAPQVIQPYRWLTFRGFLRHFGDLDDTWRWRFMRYILGLREGFTQATYDRCMRFKNFDICSGAGVVDARFRPDAEGQASSGDRPGAVELITESGPIQVDYVISATGIEVNFACRPELAQFANNIATWADRYAPPETERDARLGAFPYLNDDYSFAEKVAGVTPWIRNIHLFSIASTMSFGPSGSSINALTTAIPKLVAGVGKGLFCDDAERYWASLQAYAVPQAIMHDRAHYHPGE